ncbi:MAG: hypothetical protein IT173_07430 [Acidobacteria bacterium]|nr:hypothetical protein [Acidobacteriota bacterium]
MKERLLTLSLILLIALGCKLGATTARNGPAAETPIGENVVANALAEPEATPKPAPQANAVCPDPAKPCHHKQKHFDEWELSFKMPARLPVNTAIKSAPFYAVIMKTYPMGEDCDGGEFIEAAEADRKREQARQLERKVFAAYQCPNMGAVDYEFAGRWDAKKENVLIGNFIAIYAGTTKAEGEMQLRSLSSKYPQAQLKQMTALYELIVQ